MLIGLGSRWMLRWAGVAAHVTSSQVAVAAAGYLVLALSGRALPAAGFAAVSTFYLLINTVGRGLFAAVEMELTRAVANARAVGAGAGLARRAALRHTVVLTGGALLLVAACSPLLAKTVGAGPSSTVLLGIGTITMAASYFVRGPLAGQRRYRPYAATFWIEAGVLAVAAVGLATMDIQEINAWLSVFVLAPLIAALVVGVAVKTLPGSTIVDAGDPAPADADVAAAARPGTTGELLWTAALLVSCQGVWNIGPVLVAARLADQPELAAGFVAVAVILRAPILLFAAAQALLLPPITAMIRRGDTAALRHTIRQLTALLAVAGAFWLLVGAFLVPTVARPLFGITAVPGLLVVLLLAASTVLGAGTQIIQTQLVAARWQRNVALAWMAGLAALIAVGLLASPAVLAGALGQAVAAVVVVGLLLLCRRLALGRVP